MRMPLTATQAQSAKNLYEKWFKRHPDIKNPTDINREEKFNFAIELGWNSFRLMQQARKSNVDKFNYPFPWTHADYWKKQNA
jgi:adenine-specific DNA glycosylase